jgi:hypothetical protein
MLDYSKVRFLWRGDAGRKVSSGRYDKIYDMGPRAATGDASFSTAATRPLVDELGPYYGLNVGQIQNAIRNNSMVGAVAGTPGTLPTNYTGAQGGLTREIIGTGTENGVDYIEIKYSGTATGTVASLVLEGSTQIVATPSQVWTFSSFFKSVSGSPNSYLLRILERTDAGVYVTDSASSALSVTSTLSRFSFTRTNSANVTTARVQPQIDFVLTNGASYDFTVRIGWPQMETGSVATSPIVTTAGTASRVGDVVSLTGASSLIGQTGGTLYVEAELPSYVLGPVSSVLLGINASGNNDIFNNGIHIGLQGGVITQPRFRVASAGAETANIAMLAGQPAGIYKFAGAYASNDAAFYANGVQVGTDATVTVGANSEIYMNTAAISPVTSRQQVAWLRSVALFPTRLANATLASITTL